MNVYKQKQIFYHDSKEKNIINFGSNEQKIIINTAYNIINKFSIVEQKPFEEYIEYVKKYSYQIVK